MAVTPMSPRSENFEASLALDILRTSDGHSTQQGKDALRERLRAGGTSGITLELRVRSAFATAEKAFQWEKLRQNLEKTPGYCSPLFNKRISLLAKTADETSHNANKGLLASLNRIERAAGGITGVDGEADVVKMSQLWTKVKKEVNKDLNEELRKKMRNLVERSSPDVIEEQILRQRTEELFAIMCLPHDPKAILKASLKEVSKANRSIAKRFPDVCTAHVAKCVTQFKENLEYGKTWDASIPLFNESMQQLNAKLNIMGQAEGAIQMLRPAESESLAERACETEDTKTIDETLHQLMREIHDSVDGIVLSSTSCPDGKPFKITDLIKLLGIPLNAGCAAMTESQLAKYFADSGGAPGSFVDPTQWKLKSPAQQNNILQILRCFTVSMFDANPIMKAVMIPDDRYAVQLIQTKETGLDRESARAYRAVFTISENETGFQITGDMKKDYRIRVADLETGDVKVFGTVECATKINSTKAPNAQVTFSFGQLQPLLPRLDQESRAQREPTSSPRRNSEVKDDAHQLSPSSPSHSRERLSGEELPHEPVAAFVFDTSGRKLDEYSQKHWDAKDNLPPASPVVVHADQDTDSELD